jgi:tRNA nucleotidyltransferase (CCA-adding enzyme)
MEHTKFNAQIQSFIQSIFNIQPVIEAIVGAIHEAGGATYLVGGAVRDLILGRAVKDLDIEIHGLELHAVETLLRLFGQVDLVGKSFGVFRIHSLDVDWSLPRVDSIGRKPEVSIDPFLDITKALRRRDLTMNAMAINMINYELVDPFKGLEDIERQQLHTPDKHFFIEDPLRFYRVMQFIGRFEMQPDSELNEICAHMNLNGVSKERISDEFEKLLLKSARPSLGLRWLVHIGRAQELLPELGALIGVEQDSVWHPEGDAFEHTMQAIDAAAQLEYKDQQEKLIIMLAALCHDLGKVDTTTWIDGHWLSYGHAQESAKIAKNFLLRITIKKDLIPAIVKLVEHHMDPFLFVKDNAGASAYKRLARKLAPEVKLDMLAKLSRADRRARNPQIHSQLSINLDTDIDLFVERAHDALVLYKPEPALLQGRDFLEVVAPGPLLGKLVELAYSLQIEQNIQDKEMLKAVVLSEYKARNIKQ